MINSKYTYYLFILTMILLFGCMDNNKSIKIGVLFPMTGDAGSYGVKGEKAINMAVSEINSSAGINGRMLEAIIEDSKADPKTGVNAVQKLISIDKVPAIMGDIVSSVTLAVAPICEKNKVVLIAPTSSAPAITNAGEYIYRVWPSDLAEGSAIGRFAKEKGFKKAVILHLNNDYGISIANIFTSNFNSDKSKVIFNVSYQENHSDFKTILLNVKNKNPDVIYLAGYYSDVARILIQAKELKIKSQFLGVTAIEDEEFLKIAGNATNGIIYPLASGFNIESKDNKTQDFITNFKQKFNYTPGWVESHCYDAFMLIVEGIKHSKKTEISGSSIKKYFDNMGSYQGLTGEIIFDQNGDIIKPIVFKKVENMKFVYLK